LAFTAGFILVPAAPGLLLSISIFHVLPLDDCIIFQTVPHRGQIVLQAVLRKYKYFFTAAINLEHGLSVNNIKGGTNASILRKMPQKARDEQSQERQNEEWQACHAGDLPGLRNQNVPYR
jgi:hypothetical protein